MKKTIFLGSILLLVLTGCQTKKEQHSERASSKMSTSQVEKSSPFKTTTTTTQRQSDREEQKESTSFTEKKTSLSTIGDEQKETKQKENKKEKTETTETTETTDQHITSSEINETQPLWNEQKAAQLAQFMSRWGETMGQTYESFTPEYSASFYGFLVPQEIITAESLQPAVNEQPANFVWSTDGQTPDAQYQIVATYSDVNGYSDSPYNGLMEQHVYLFVFQNGQPHVLMSMQNQGNEKNYFYLQETQNQALKQGFLTIVAQP